MNYKCYICNWETKNSNEIYSHLKKNHGSIICEPKQKHRFQRKFEINFNMIKGKSLYKENNTHDDFIMRTIYKYGYYEPLISTFFIKILEKGDTFIDIGANIGYYSILCSDICKNIHSFEPMESIFNDLKKNLEINKIKNVKINKKAISNKKCMMTFNYGCSAISENGKIEVDNISLDEYFQLEKIKSVKLIKIDVEGHEENVLDTMKITLKKNKVKYVMCEVKKETFENVCNTMNKFGYDKICDLNTGFGYKICPLNATLCVSIDQLFEIYKLTDKTPRNCNLLFFKD